MAGLSLAHLGIGAVVIAGKSPTLSPKVLVIQKHREEIVEAPDLAARGNYETVAALRKRFGEGHVVISVGPCGEMTMGAATVAVTDTSGRPCRHAARGGLGAVMGAKGLKAIVIDPTGAEPRRGEDPAAFAQAAKEYTQMLQSSKRTAFWRENGTAGLVDASHARGSMPTRNFTAGA
jgi:aldehyde:ferredoxin oxidoreductase